MMDFRGSHVVNFLYESDEMINKIIPQGKSKNLLKLRGFFVMFFSQKDKFHFFNC